MPQTVKNLQCGRPGFDPKGGKIPWRRAWLPPPVFLPGESHGQRSLVSYSPWVAQPNMTEQLNTFTFRGFVKKVAFGQRLEGSVNVGHVALSK